MSEYLYQDYPPLPSVLSSLVNLDNSKNINNNSYNILSKAFRLYVEIISFYDSESNFELNFQNKCELKCQNKNDHQQEERDIRFFNQSNWKNELGEKVANYTIKKWLDKFDVKPKQWFDEFQAKYNVQLTEEQKQEILNLIPFYCLQEVSKEEIKNNYSKIFTRNLKKLEQQQILDAIPDDHQLKQKFQNLKKNKVQQIFKNLSESEKKEILSLVDVDCLKKILKPILQADKEKTFRNDFKDLVKYGFLIKYEDKKYKFSKLSIDQIKNKLNIIKKSSDLFEDLETNILDLTLRTTLDTFKNNERFFIKFQHILNQEDTAKVGNIIDELRQIWEKENQLIFIKYQSSSQKKQVDLIIYPITLFYNQRAIYLAGYGPTPYDEKQCNYYNYRLDRFCPHLDNKYIYPIIWDEDQFYQWKDQIDHDDKLPCILLKLFDDKINIEQWKQDHIYQQLSQALGVDTEKTIKTMLLRFPHDFHQGYIKGSQRHETFKQIEYENNNDNFLTELKCILTKEKKSRNSQTEITENDEKLIRKTLEKYPQDAYYTMNYRHGEEGGYNVESDVVMRLRAWCPNVEVLLPNDLRKRMREDMQKTWELYQDDQ